MIWLMLVIVGALVALVAAVVKGEKCLAAKDVVGASRAGLVVILSVVAAFVCSLWLVFLL